MIKVIRFRLAQVGKVSPSKIGWRWCDRDARQGATCCGAEGLSIRVLWALTAPHC